ncbi:MAG: DUF1028 domain-containing protein [Gammaproteobacteria bacterium]|nr:DUF1028 domain-containing protein [Gammaproteobacteria bacterium]
MTFSIAARCAETGMFGVGVCSSSPAVAARCSHARAGVGAATSQNVTDPGLGSLILDNLAQGLTARESVERAAESTEQREFRQLTAVDRTGGAFVFTGKHALGISAGCTARDVACAGNLLTGEEIPGVMVEAFRHSAGHLGDRLLASMRAALDAGGEAGPVHSAGIMVVRDLSWPIVDLRVDWTDDECPVERLADIWQLYAPQVEDYVIRALNPGDAPGYGVPGDE